MKWSSNSCNCGSGNQGAHAFYARDYNFRTTTDQSAVLRCLQCGSLYSEISSLAIVQNAYLNYYTTPRQRLGSRRLMRRLVDLTRWQYMMRATPRYARTLLDYGCGSGEFLSSLKEAGFDAELYGTDLFKRDRRGQHRLRVASA